MTKIQSAAFLLVLSLMAVLASKKLPVDIQRCKINDGVCMATSTNYFLKTFPQGNRTKGITDLGFPTFEPLYVPKMEFKAKTTGTVRLDQTYYDVNTQGVSQIKIISVTPLITDTQCKLNIKLSAPYLKISGRYTATGTLLGFSPDGDGPFHIILLNSEMDLEFDCAKTGDGFVKIVRVTVDLTAPTIDLEFQNLVKTNQKFSNTILRILKEQSQNVFGELKTDYEDALANVFKNLISIIFNSVSINDLFLP